MDRVGFEPTTSASFSSATTIHLKDYQQHEEILFKSHPVPLIREIFNTWFNGAGLQS
jgi:hypothetical protein